MKWLFPFLIVFLYSVSHAQNVGIGTASPNKSAILELSDSTRGFLPPRLKFSQRNAMATPVAGLVIWCSDCAARGELQVYNGISWRNLLGMEASGLPYEIGQPALGGIIAYILQPADLGYDPNIQHGLIASTTDITPALFSMTTASGATDTLIGTGNKNTNLIVALVGGAGGYAATDCYNLIRANYSDWFLPSKHELNQLYLHKTIIGGFSNTYYWSSSEKSSSQAWVQDFTNGEQAAGLKDNFWFNIRPIRAF